MWEGGRDGETNADDVWGTWCKVAKWDTTECRPREEESRTRKEKAGLGSEIRRERNEAWVKVARSRTAVPLGEKGESTVWAATSEGRERQALT
ncbi:hypothetical protein MRX96_047535 [Rhipicephalus microplus]